MSLCCDKYTVPGACEYCPFKPKEYYTPPPQTGWICPKCGGSNAPSQTHCVLCPPPPIPEPT